MARCGCSQACGCAVIADPLCPNVTVAGNGSFENPFKICVEEPEGAAKPYATLVIAAADSVAPGAEFADFVCDGIADDVQINAAINSLFDATFRGGRVLLLEGTYHLAALIDGGTNPFWSGGGYEGAMMNITLEGQGIGNTVLLLDQVDPGPNFLLYMYASGDESNFQLKNLTCDGNNYADGYGVYVESNSTVCENVEFTRLHIQNFAQLDMFGNRQRVTGCKFDETTDEGAYGLICRGDQCRITDNHVFGQPLSGMLIQGDNNTVADNTSRESLAGAGIEVTGNRNAVSGNVCFDNFTYGVDVSGDENVVDGNSLCGNFIDAVNDTGTDNVIGDNACVPCTPCGGGGVVETVSDTDSIDLVLTGSDLTADVILVPDATGPLGADSNLLKLDATGLYVVCADIEECGITPEFGAYTDYSASVVLNQAGARTTSSTIAHYVQYGKMVHYWGRVTCSQAGSAGALISISLPVAAHASLVENPQMVIGGGYVEDVGAALYPALCRVNSASASSMVFVRTEVSADTNIGTSPSFALANNDKVQWNVTYEAA